MSSKHFKGGEQRRAPRTPWGPDRRSFHDQDDGEAPRYGEPVRGIGDATSGDMIALPRREWSSDDPVEDTWKHGDKSQELRILVARCLRATPQLFVRQEGDNRFTISLRDRNVIPRTYFVEKVTYDDAMKYLDSLL